MLMMRGVRGRSAWVRVVGAGLAMALGLAARGGDDDEAAAGGASGDDVLVGLITKTDTNPFFVKMREGAEATAEELGIELQSFAGEEDGDNQSQVDASTTSSPPGPPAS